MTKPGYLPTDLNNPTYWTSGSKDQLTLVAKYVTPTEWAELAKLANDLSDKYSYVKHPCGLPLLICTLGVCFCPLIYLGQRVEPGVNADLAKLSIVGTLNKRGIGVSWEPRRKFTFGGLTLTFSAETPLAQA